MSSPRAADRDSWKNQPLPSQSATLSLIATYTLHDYERIKRGLVPAEMEDKWFIFFDDDIDRQGNHCLAKERTTFGQDLAIKTKIMWRDDPVRATAANWHEWPDHVRVRQMPI